MVKPEFIARQSAHPRGLLGHVVARVMALDTAAENAWVLRELCPAPGERILEVGCGHGRALKQVAERVVGGEVLGLDPSDVMCSVARRHNRRWIESARIRIVRGAADDIPAPDDGFDKAFSVHSIYFWPDLAAGLGEIRRVLRRGGHLFLAFRSSEDDAFAETLPRSVYTLRSPDEVVDALLRSGFQSARAKVDPAQRLHLVRACV